MLSFVTLKAARLHCCARSRTCRCPIQRRQFYCSLREDIGKAISNAKPSFVAGGDGGCGSVRPALFPLSGVDFVSAPMATLVTTGGSQVSRRLSLVWPVLIVFMADLRTIKPSSLLWDRVNHGKTRQEGATAFNKAAQRRFTRARFPAARR